MLRIIGLGDVDGESGFQFWTAVQVDWKPCQSSSGYIKGELAA